MGISEKIFCAFCRHERKIYNKKHVTWTNVGIGFLVTSLVDLGVIGPFSEKSILVFVSVICLSELFIQIRWRMGLSCPYCGFDPVLYLNSKKRAMEKVKARLEWVKSDEAMKFSAKNPYKYLPVKRVKSNNQSSKLSHLGLKEKIGWTKEASDAILPTKENSIMPINEAEQLEQLNEAASKD